MNKFGELSEQLRGMKREKALAKQLSLFCFWWHRQPAEVLELNNKVQRLESELNGTYKENQQNATQILELTKKIKELEFDHREMETKLRASNEYNNQKDIIIKQNVVFLL